MQNLQVAVVGNLGDAAFCIDVEPAAEQFGHVRLEVAQVDVWVGRVRRFRLRHRGCGSARLSHALLCLTNAESLNNELLREATLQLRIAQRHQRSQMAWRELAALEQDLEIVGEIEQPQCVRNVRTRAARFHGDLGDGAAARGSAVQLQG